MKCRVCGSVNLSEKFSYEAHKDYSVDIYDCFDCGSRFVPRDPNIYEQLHSAESGYSTHDEYAIKAEKLFRTNNVDELKDFLCQIEKNKFVIETVSNIKNINNLLEIGCSCGYLTSFFIAKGYSIFGTDISPSAVDKANRIFGNNFCLSDDDKIANSAPYDAIYHVGTIGCVDSPIKTTKELLKLLKPGGHLVFNAPNRDSCDRFDVPWVMGTQPPDLVTLFTKDFWEKEFCEFGTVSVEIKPAHSYAWPAYKLQSIFNYRPTGLLLSNTDNISRKSKLKLVPLIKILLTLISKLPIFPSIPGDFGIMVIIKKD